MHFEDLNTKHELQFTYQTDNIESKKEKCLCSRWRDIFLNVNHEIKLTSIYKLQPINRARVMNSQQGFFTEKNISRYLIIQF